MSQIVYVADRTLVAVERNRLLLPPTFTRYFTWGYPDHSARIALVEGDRVRGGVGRRGEEGWEGGGGGGRKGREIGVVRREER